MMHTDRMRGELAALLRSHREALQPEDLGFSRGKRRRSRGLRREEVASLADVSTSWYMWLEQGRDIQPSLHSLLRVAHALQLSDSERLYASLLAGFGKADQACEGSGEVLSLGTIQRTLDAFLGVPAALFNSRFEILNCNAAARAVYGSDVAHGDKWERNTLWRFFTDPVRRQMYPDSLMDRGIRNLIGALRLNWANADDGGMAIQELVDQLRSDSAEFDLLWRRRDVAKLSTVPGCVRPIGSKTAISIAYTRLSIPNAPQYIVAVLVPTDSVSAIALEQHLNRVG
jgi:transcriptional regulator with XRE-family HTH domain